MKCKLNVAVYQPKTPTSAEVQIRALNGKYVLVIPVLTDFAIFFHTILFQFCFDIRHIYNINNNFYDIPIHSELLFSLILLLILG